MVFAAVVIGGHVGAGGPGVFLGFEEKNAVSIRLPEVRLLRFRSASWNSSCEHERARERKKERKSARETESVQI